MSDDDLFIRRVLDEIESKRWYDDGELRRPEKIVSLSSRDALDPRDLGQSVRRLFELVEPGCELEPVVLASLEWRWSLQCASVERVDIGSGWHVYLGSGDAGPSAFLLAAARTPTVGADRAVVESVFRKGGEAIGMPFVYNAPSSACFHEQFEFDEAITWLAEAVDSGSDSWEVVYENVVEPEEWDGWLPEPPEPEEPRSTLPAAEIAGKRAELDKADLGFHGSFKAMGHPAEVRKRLDVWMRRKDPAYAQAMRTYRTKHAAWKKKIEKSRSSKQAEFHHHLMSRYAREFMGWQDTVPRCRPLSG